MTKKRDPSMQQVLDATNEAREMMMEAAKAIAVDERYGTLSGNGDADGWDRLLVETLFNASDLQMQAGFLALGVAHYIRGFDNKLDRFRIDLEDRLQDDTDAMRAHKAGVMVTIKSVRDMLGERDPMKLYEFYLDMLNDIDKKDQ